MPQMMSPTCRLSTDSSTVYMGLTDASSEDENQGDIDRSNLCYSPDITYHMQELLKMDADKLAGGNYDIWLLIMAYRTTVVTNSEANEMSDLYSVSLEHLLKEEMGMEDKYLAYLEESTNKVRSNDRLAKAALIAAVLFIYAMTQRIFWSAAQGMDLTNYTVVFKYILLPMSALLLSVYAGKGDWWGKWKWALTAIIGGLFLLVPSVSFARFDEGSAMMTFIFPNIRYLFAGCAVSVIGLLLGERVHRK